MGKMDCGASRPFNYIVYGCFPLSNSYCRMTMELYDNGDLLEKPGEKKKRERERITDWGPGSRKTAYESVYPFAWGSKKNTMIIVTHEDLHSYSKQHS